MRLWTRVAFGLQRGEVLVVGVALFAWTLAAGIAWQQLRGASIAHPECFGLVVSVAPCTEVPLEFITWDQWAEAFQWVGLAWPLILGVALGVPIVARELEGGTAQLVWAFASARGAWLWRRSLPILAICVAGWLLVGMVGELLAHARLPGQNPGFQHYDQRGFLVLSRGLVVLSISVLVGARVGSTLPAFLLSVAIAASTLVATVVGLDAWRESSAALVATQEMGPGIGNPMVLGPAAVLPDGSVTRQRNEAALPQGTTYDWMLIIPEDQYAFWIGREVLLDLVIATGMATMAVSTVRRRRPD
jgi:hypothetical protein